MGSLAIARSRRAAESVTVHTVCPHQGRTYIERYGDAECCWDCGAVLNPGTPGRAQLDLEFACGVMDTDEYQERLDALMGHP